MIEFLLGVAFGLSLGVVVGGMLRHTSLPEPPPRRQLEGQGVMLVVRYRTGDRHVHSYVGMN